MPSMNDSPCCLKHRDALLEQIVAETRELTFSRMAEIVVTFRVDGADGEFHRYDFDLWGALNAIASDLYWDERGDWSEATNAFVEVL